MNIKPGKFLEFYCFIMYLFKVKFNRIFFHKIIKSSTNISILQSILEYDKHTLMRFFATFIFSLNIFIAFLGVCSSAPCQITSVSGDLMFEIQTIKNNMPNSQSEGFVKPTSIELNRWHELMVALFEIKVETVDSLIQVYFPFYKLFRFTDIGLNDNVYYLLKEKIPVTKGWGTFIINPDFVRPIAIEIPHPVYDLNTHAEGTDIFRRTGAMVLIMAGTHRCANSEQSPCDGSFSGCGGTRYAISDMAHYVQSPFQIAHETLYELFSETYSFSIHGHSRESCEDIFLSNGHITDSKNLLYDLKSSLLTSGGLSVAVAGDGTSSCVLIGSTNVQGRFTNRSTAPCTIKASSTNGYFIHVEQRRRVRESFSLYSKLISAINQNISSITSVEEKDISDSESAIVPTPIRLYPNPFHNKASIDYQLFSSDYVSLKVFNLRGQVVRVLEDNVYKDNGVYNMFWDGRNHANILLPNGFYFVQLLAGLTVSNTKVLLMRK